MPDNDISPELLEQAREAGAPVREAMETPTDGATLAQPEPNVPDMSGVPDPYDVQGQEQFRADQREQAIEIRDTVPEQEAALEVSVNTPVGELSESSYEAMLEAAQQYKDAINTEEVTTATPEATTDAAAPERDASLEPSPEPQAPEIDKE